MNKAGRKKRKGTRVEEGERGGKGNTGKEEVLNKT